MFSPTIMLGVTALYALLVAGLGFAPKAEARATTVRCRLRGGHAQPHRRCDRGQLTVFAPTDTAFEALLAELGVTAEELLASTELLTDVLLYHVSNGRQPSNGVIQVIDTGLLP